MGKQHGPSCCPRIDEDVRLCSFERFIRKVHRAPLAAMLGQAPADPKRPHRTTRRILPQGEAKRRVSRDAAKALPSPHGRDSRAMVIGDQPGLAAMMRAVRPAAPIESIKLINAKAHARCAGGVR
jgi:hypothetical protein